MNTEAPAEAPPVETPPVPVEPDPPAVVAAKIRAELQAEFEVAIDALSKRAAEDVKREIEVERESCARCCEKYGGSMIGKRLAANIRKRGAK